MTRYKRTDERQFGAGGTEGGFGRFFLGLIMLIGGIYLLLTNIHVGSMGGMGGFGRTLTYGSYSITSGFVLIPFIFGLGMIFYNSRNYLGWFLTFASMIMLIVGVITDIHFHFGNLNLFELIIILILGVGGAGLLLSSLRSSRSAF